MKLSNKESIKSPRIFSLATENMQIQNTDES
jgi:hypothetical protein